MTNYYLLPGLSVSPTIVGRLVNAIPDSKYDTPTHPGRFTIREVIAHMADFEPIFLDRMKSAVQSPGFTIQVRDEGAMAIANNYAASIVSVQLDQWRALRAKTVEWLKSLREDEWNATFEHPEQGTFSVFGYACTMLAHDVYHMDQITEMFEAKIAGTW